MDKKNKCLFPFNVYHIKRPPMIVTDFLILKINLFYFPFLDTNTQPLCTNSNTYS